ncbi:MAG: hypothetical protein DWQ05_07015 [Calditrichaeota bacterium]|nr:MAG: hypothetical protein DWQ05_07015 [Calditrichota bacterium]
MHFIFRILFSVAIFTTVLSCSQEEPAQHWFRGNTHAHTVICGHADSTPEFVTAWYHERGYNFLILSEHNHFIDPDSVKMPQPLRDDFILIPGEEVSGHKVIHSTAMNIDTLVNWDFNHEHVSEIIQFQVDGAIAANGHTILNHPNYEWAITAADILPVKKLYMFELYNGHPSVRNHGDETHPSTEKMWDELLTKGMKIYGVSSDDAHDFQKIADDESNPGRGWVMVKSQNLTPDAITEAMNHGQFYSSNGVFLKKCGVNNGVYSIEIDEAATMKELLSPDIFGKKVDEKENGFFIEFIGPEGKVLSHSKTMQAKFKIDDSSSYVRAKVTFTRTHKAGGSEEFYAWGQPVFTDERKKDH